MAPILLILGLVVGVRDLRGRRERESLDDAVALKLEKKRRRARRIGFLILPVWLLPLIVLLWMGSIRTVPSWKAMDVLTTQMIEGIYSLSTAMGVPLAILFKGNARK